MFYFYCNYAFCLKLNQKSIDWKLLKGSSDIIQLPIGRPLLIPGDPVPESEWRRGFQFFHKHLPVCSAARYLQIQLFTTNIQGLSERMIKVKCLWKSKCSQKFSFLSCFRSETSGKFIQVHHKYPEASSEAGVSDVLSGSDWQFEAVHWPETLRKGPHSNMFKSND